jgi:hypothetical protein
MHTKHPHVFARLAALHPASSHSRPADVHVFSPLFKRLRAAGVGLDVKQRDSTATQNVIEVNLKSFCFKVA